MLRLNNLETGTAMNVEFSVSVICVEAIIYLLLYNLHDCNFNGQNSLSVTKAFCRCSLNKNYEMGLARLSFLTSGSGME